MHATNNTSDCCKYKKDGNRKKGFGKGTLGSIAMGELSTNAYVQLSTKIAKLEEVSK